MLLASDYGWGGIKVRHQDGRFGVIEAERPGKHHVDLLLRVHGQLDRVVISLRLDGPDRGEHGWEWRSGDTRHHPWTPFKTSYLLPERLH